MFLPLHDPDDNSLVIVNFNLIAQFYKSRHNEVTILVPVNASESIYVTETVEQILEMLK